MSPTTPSSAPQPTTPTTNPLTSLRSVSDLLHLSFHHNKNQHRLAKWWSSLSQLRRQVQKLVTELEALETAERYDVKPLTKKAKKAKRKDGEEEVGVEGKYVVAAREKVRERVDFMERWLVPGCYTAFTNLIADNQYAPLGLILMATLARTKRIIIPFGSNLASPSPSPPPASPILSSNHGPAMPEQVPKYDLGEVVSRSAVHMGDPVARTSGKGGAELEEEESMREGGVKGSRVDGKEDENEDRVQVKKTKKKRKEVVDEDSAEVSSTTTTPKAKRPKKKKKGGDAFDDLFSSLM